MTNTQSEKAPLELIAASLRRERRRTGLSLTEVARRAGIAKSTLSQLESGTGNPSVETLWAIAVALGVPFSRVVDPQPQPVRVIRAGTGPAVPSTEASYTATVLSTCPPGARRDLHVINLEPGASRVAESHLPGTVEHLVIISGRVRCGVSASCALPSPWRTASRGRKTKMSMLQESQESLFPGSGRRSGHSRWCRSPLNRLERHR